MTLFSQPTAPFREYCVRRLIESRLLENKYPHFCDPFGNLVLGANSVPELKRILSQKKKPISLFVAHMDHPGFHIPKKSAKPFTQQSLSKPLNFIWHGGSPLKDLKGAELYVSNPEGEWSPARILKAKLHKSGHYMESGQLRITHPERLRSSQEILFGGYHFKSFAWQKGDLVFTKAADDLAGVFALVESFLSTQNKNTTTHPIGLLTTAEEVGWVGALAHFKRFDCWKNAKAEVTAISLEASRTLKRAEMGKGPVVRLGDKASIFDSARSEKLLELACRATKKKFQWRVMDGGTCEGSVTLAHNIPTVALCVPLGNYHNMNFEGGMRSSKAHLGPAPEFVNKQDLQGLVLICKEVITKGLLLKKDNYSRKRKKLEECLVEYKNELQESLKLNKSFAAINASRDKASR